MSRIPLFPVIIASIGWVGMSSGQETPIDFATQIQPLFDGSCAFNGCHAGPAPRMGLNLESGRAYASIVNTPSQEAPAVVRVRPGDPQNSYLYRKLKGEQSQLGGSGSQMPFGASPISAAQLKLMEDWISQGALSVPPSRPTSVSAQTWGLIKRLIGGNWKTSLEPPALRFR